MSKSLFSTELKSKKMFNGIYTHTFKNKPTNALVVKKLNKVGLCNEVNGNISLTPFDSNFSFESKALVSFTEYENNYTLQIQYSFNPTIVAWLLGICFFPLGFLLFYFPYKAKEDFSDQLFVMKWEE